MLARRRGTDLRTVLTVLLRTVFFGAFLLEGEALFLDPFCLPLFNGVPKAATAAIETSGRSPTATADTDAPPEELEGLALKIAGRTGVLTAPVTS